MINKYEEIYKRNKALNTTYAVGYGKMALSFWCIVIGLVVIWFRWKIGLLLIAIGFILSLWASSQKNRHSKIKTDKIVKDYSDKKVSELLYSDKKESAHLLYPCLGREVVFTGELRRYSRSEAENLVTGLGGSISSIVTKNTDYVVAGKNPDSKYDKAKQLSIKILGEVEFKKMAERMEK